MSIVKEYGKWVLICDNCGTSLDKSYDSFNEAREAKRNAEWKSVKVDGDWEDWCEDCSLDIKKQY